MSGTLERTAEKALARWGRDKGGNGWAERHADAVKRPAEGEVAFVDMFRAWEAYADDHRDRHGAPIGDDGYTGPEWAMIGQALRALLSCDHGPRLDGGTLDGAIIAVWKRNGFNGEGEVA